jgi:exodeoxyribonuclease VII small subunit
VTVEIEKLSFEDPMRELESIVRDLETGKAKLDDAVRAYERGAALKADCEAKLTAAHAKIEQITVGPDGKVSSAFRHRKTTVTYCLLRRKSAGI